MPERSISDLYRDVIKKHEREPFHYQKMEDAAHVIEAYNPLCGDQFKLYLQIEDGVVTSAHFHGYGCAISKASTSVLMKKMQGMPVEHLRALCQHFQNIVSAETEEPDEEISAFAAARQFPERLPCATLSWEALEDFLKKL